MEPALYLECECNSPEHLIKVELIDEDFVITVQLVHWRPWWKRIFIAIRYILGLSEPYGHWDCSILKAIDVRRLIAILERN